MWSTAILLEDVRLALWRELAEDEVRVNPRRCVLQRTHGDVLAELAGGPIASDARAAWRQQLEDVRGETRAAWRVPGMEPPGSTSRMPLVRSRGCLDPRARSGADQRPDGSGVPTLCRNVMRPRVRS